MGNCCPCFKSSNEDGESTAVERKPLLSHEAPPPVEATKQFNKADHYKNVVDTAQRNFINSSGLRMFAAANSDSEALRGRLSNVEMTPEAAHTIVNSPPSKYSHAWEGTQQNSSQQVIDTLSQPVTSVYKYDNVADEMAEMIAKHTFSMDVDDSANSTVASFKPINTASV